MWGRLTFTTEVSSTSITALDITAMAIIQRFREPTEAVEDVGMRQTGEAGLDLEVEPGLGNSLAVRRTELRVEAFTSRLTKLRYQSQGVRGGDCRHDWYGYSPGNRRYRRLHLEA
jgi:hypothetical protein